MNPFMIIIIVILFLLLHFQNPDKEHFPKSELFKFIDQCTDPAHSSIYRKDDRRRCDHIYSYLCCCFK